MDVSSSSSRVWIPVLDSHYAVSRNLVPKEEFLDVLYRKGVLLKDEKRWLLKISFLDDGRRLVANKILLYSILCRHSNAIHTYQVLLDALLASQQNEVLETIIRSVRQCREDEDQSDSICNMWGPSSPSDSSSQGTTTLIVDMIVDMKLLIKIQEFRQSIHTWLCREVLGEVDHDQVAIHLHVVRSHEQQTQHVIIIYPSMETQDDAKQGPQVKEPVVVQLQGILQAEECGNLNCPKCDVELIGIRGLNHLFKPKSEVSPRSEFSHSSNFSRNFSRLSLSSQSRCSKSTDIGMFSPDEIETLDCVGNGKYSKVLKVRMAKTDKIAALKTAIDDKFIGDKKPFLNELRAFKSIDGHINVIELLGAVISEQHVERNLLFEYAENGDLDNLLSQQLEHHPTVSKQLKQRLVMALDIARGMEHIHQTIYHLDLMTSSVLVTRDYHCKISDFGCCEFLGGSQSSTFWVRSCTDLGSNTVFIAPERYQDNRWWTAKKKSKSDVFGFSMILYQLINLKKPWQGKTSDAIRERILTHQRPSLRKHDDCPKHIVNIAKSCWENYPDSRPTFYEIVDEMKTLAQPTLAQPTSAQPTSAQPTSAQPTSAQPTLVTLAQPTSNLNSDLSKGDSIRGTKNMSHESQNCEVSQPVKSNQDNSPRADYLEDNHVSSSSYFVRPAVSVPESVSPQEANATGRSHPTQIAGTSFVQQPAFPMFKGSAVYTKTTDGLPHPNQQTSASALVYGSSQIVTSHVSQSLTMSRAQQNAVAKRITNVWPMIATELDPEHFDANCIDGIKKKHPSDLRMQAVEMVQQWANKFSRHATAHRMAVALCKEGQRIVAEEELGTALVEFVVPP
ncbi:receptor-interacting serine/threonine-protein kinase 1-like isoform X3 [Corticium candelabrum]|uniref:receptor-interacting serine/threonine-protein kinase 1-like isoform X3 n=1 Tax=Corticium candelabrum TaxID=121492 RepID=UPI002E25FBA1|nr:receptor-interacting serine/threonine-protein kinase 1-like isoform X3 [Corticium candelabrum]